MAMNGYTKLFNSIVASTIWSEADETRIIWITMLAMANQRGVVETSIPGLAVLARIHVDKCREAIVTLESPDVDSRSQEHEGRRIQKIDGGWLILNHAKYRAKLNADERREYKTIKQREYRKKTPVDNSGLSYPLRTHTEAEADTEADTEEKQKRAAAAFSALDCEPFGSEDFRKMWTAAFEGHEDGKPWSDSMERVISQCNNNKIKVPARFFTIKRHVEKVDAQNSFRPRAPL